jgi:hypothetical protein
VSQPVEPSAVEAGLTRRSGLGTSRRSFLFGSATAAALIASPDLFSGERARAAEAAAGGAAYPAFFIYGFPAPSANPGTSILASRPPALRAPAPVSLRPVAPHLAPAFPVKSPDAKSLALVAWDESPATASITVALVDAASMAVVSTGTLPLPDLPAGTSLLVTSVFGDASTVALVLSITVPTSTRPIAKLDPRKGKTVTRQAVTWVSHHALAYFDGNTASFSGPYDLSDPQTLALVSVAADSSRLYLWTMKDTSAMRPWKGHPERAPVPRFAAYPLGSAKPIYSVAAPGPFPTGQEPVITLSTGDIARLINGREIQLYSAMTGRMSHIGLAPLDLPTTKPGAVTMQSRPDGMVFINNPAMGRAILADPARSFREVWVVGYPLPAVPFGGPAEKAALSPDGGTLYVLGPLTAGGLSAYDTRTGTLVASYSHGENYVGVYQLASGVVLAISAASPQLAFFNPSLAPVGVADAEIQVVGVF